MIAARMKGRMNPSWWHFSRSPGWTAVSKGMHEENRVRFEMYWRAHYMRGFLTEHLSKKLSGEFTTGAELVNAISFATMVWIKRQMVRDNADRYGAFSLQPLAFGIASDEKAVGLTVRVEGWELEAYVKGRLLTVVIDGKKSHTRSEFDRDITDLVDVITTGKWPGVHIETETGEIHTKECRDPMTPGIIIGSRDGHTAYQRQQDGSVRRVTEKRNKRGVR